MDRVSDKSELTLATLNWRSAPATLRINAGNTKAQYMLSVFMKENNRPAVR
jgi:hypothetical protein